MYVLRLVRTTFRLDTDWCNARVIINVLPDDALLEVFAGSSSKVHRVGHSLRRCTCVENSESVVFELPGDQSQIQATWYFHHIT